MSVRPPITLADRRRTQGGESLAIFTTAFECGPYLARQSSVYFVCLGLTGLEDSIFSLATAAASRTWEDGSCKAAVSRGIAWWAAGPYLPSACTACCRTKLSISCK